jgi:hypothetical protein
MKEGQEETIVPLLEQEENTGTLSNVGFPQLCGSILQFIHPRFLVLLLYANTEIICDPVIYIA